MKKTATAFLIASLLLAGCSSVQRKFPLELRVLHIEVNTIHYPLNLFIDQPADVKKKALPPGMWLEMISAILENVTKIFQYGYQARTEGGRNELCWQVKVVDLFSLRWGKDNHQKKVKEVMGQHRLWLGTMMNELTEVKIATGEAILQREN